MQATDMIRIFAIIAIIVVVLLAAIVLTTIATRNRDSARSVVERSRAEIASCRKQRHVLIKQMLSMFGQSNPQNTNLEKLCELYPKANTEQRELEWEKKYIPVMQAFMAYAQTNARPEVASSWAMANQSIIDNEAKLSTARANYLSAKETLDAYSRTPRSYAISFGDFILHLFNQYQDTKTTRQELGEQDGQE